jgi:hypothetical protein
MVRFVHMNINIDARLLKDTCGYVMVKRKSYVEVSKILVSQPSSLNA